MDEATYLARSASTESRAYHSENIPPAELDRMMDAAEAATAWADRVKKALFYGKSIELKTSYKSQTSLVHNQELSQLIHSVLGIFTEAGEMLQHLHEILTGQTEMDRVNLIEELGDLYWYTAILHRVTNSLPSDVWATNIAKLDRRYPQGFNEQCAITRDIDSERQVLEQHAEQQKEATL